METKSIIMRNLKITAILFLVSIPIFTLLAYMDYETNSITQVFLTKEGLSFLLFYGIIFTVLGWIVIGVLRLNRLRLNR